MKIDRIIRSRRKTFALMIKSDGTLVVRAPLAATSVQIERIVQQKADWIQKKQAEVKQRQSQSPPKQFSSGETFLFLGAEYPLVIAQKQSRPLVLTHSYFHLSHSALPRAREVFTHWYQQQARQIFTERAAFYAAHNGLDYKSIRITSARTRWGSCSSKGNLSFTWRLVMAPPQVIDYVVAHELAHLQVRNHSPAFWQKVKTIMPDYLQYRRWLDAHGHLLTL